MEPLLLAPLTLIGVLAWSGVAKVRDPVAASDGFIAMQVPLIPPSLGAWTLPLLELALATALLFSRGTPLLVAAVAAAVLFAAYWLLIARAWRSPQVVRCACFGTQEAVDARTVLRNTMLVLLAAGTIAYAVTGAAVSTSLAQARAGQWSMLLVALLVGVLGWSLGASASEEPDYVSVDEGDADYIRRPIPELVLTTPDGDSVVLTDLAASQARLIILLNSRCGPCRRVGSMIDGWAARLGPSVGVHALYADATVETLPGTHAADLALFDRSNVAFPMLNRGGGAPSAILLGVDGLYAGGPVFGEDSVAKFVADIEQQLLNG